MVLPQTLPAELLDFKLGKGCGGKVEGSRSLQDRRKLSR